jgi:hypothetical protein
LNGLVEDFKKGDRKGVEGRLKAMADRRRQNNT